MISKASPLVVAKHNPLQYYLWGKNCEAWSLVDNDQLSFKVEKMPAATEEVLHYHKQAQQFFYIIKGRAVFEVDEVVIMVHEGEGLQIEAGRKHRLMNKEEIDLEFIVCSQPSTTNDRFDIT